MPGGGVNGERGERLHFVLPSFPAAETVMGRPEIDPVKLGDRFGTLVVIRLNESYHLDPHGYKRKKHLCQCDCGKQVVILATALKNGNTQSCGCQGSRVTIAQQARIHGHTVGGQWTPEYRAWTKMIARCYDLSDAKYGDYGGRGIKVYDEWRRSFQSFYDHVGNRPSSRHSIDRINTNGNYEPGNVRWASPTQQARNKRTNRLLTYQGETRCVREWEDVLGFKKGVLGARLYLGWRGEDLFRPQVIRFSRRVVT